MPPLAIVLTRRYALLLKPPVWASAAVVALCALPWYTATLPLAFYGHSSLGFAAQARENLPLFFQQIWSEMSFLAVLALIGLGLWIARAKTSLRCVEASIAVLPLAVLISVLLAKVDLEPRHDIPAIAPLLIAAVAGARVLLGAASRKLGRAWITPAGLLACTAAFAAGSHLPALIENAAGVSQLATQTLQEAGARGTTILIAAPSAAREGRIMAELAMQSPKRPLNVVVRATKLLADIDWNATTYETCCQTPAEAMQVLERSGVDLLVLDVTGNADPAWTHYRFLMEIPGLYPSHFQELGVFPANAHPTYRLYRVVPVRNPIPRPDLMLQKLDRKFGAPVGRKP